MINKVKEIHDFIISRGGRAASIPSPEPLPEERITEMINGALVTRPVNKVTNLNKSTTTLTTSAESEPQITTLNDSWERQDSKAAASVQGINKIREIHDFINKRF